MLEPLSSSSTARQLDVGTVRPTFSIIIPTYNRAELIQHAVRSALTQTWPDREVVVVDDGSTDRTRESLEPFAGQIRYVHQENRGLASARNRGIEESTGEFIAFLDSDDRFEPRMLEATFETFHRFPAAGGVVTAEREIDRSGSLRPRVYTKRSPGEFFTSAGLITRDTRIGCGRPAVVRRHWVEELGGFDESIRCAVDCEIWIRYSFHMPLVFQPEPLVRRCVHASNLSRDRLQDASDWLQILSNVERTEPEFVRANRRLFDRALAKQYLRVGRELLANENLEPTALAEARRALSQACRLAPLWVRARTYLLWSHLAPATYSSFRRWELRRFESTGEDSKPNPPG